MNTENLTYEQSDSFRELGNIGAAHAATTLSTILSTSVGIEIPDITFVNLANLHEHLDTGVVAHVIFQIQGDVQTGGYVILHIPKESAVRLTNLMVGAGDPGPDRELTEMDYSAIDEVGNIMISAFLDACAELLGLILLPSPPTSIFDIPHAVMESILVTLPGIEDIDEVVLFKTNLSCSDHHIASNIMLLPSRETLNMLLERLDKLVSG
ncbi:MAG: chemotaxis protein CheC [Euryarchaeota archaeon]|nr:chemotaxis protein CheC [Euryarchaeota archaeon]